MLLITLLFFKNTDAESKHFYTAIRAKCFWRQQLGIHPISLMKDGSKTGLMWLFWSVRMDRVGDLIPRPANEVYSILQIQ